jgi:hypothetical protein
MPEEILPVLEAHARRPESPGRIGEGLVVLARSVLGGLHHEYSLAPAVP